MSAWLGLAVGGRQGLEIPSRRAICVDLIMVSCRVGFAVVGLRVGVSRGCSGAELASLLRSVLGVP